MAKIRSHYDNLTVAKNASPRVIKAAYKALCQVYHPDKFEGGREEAERIMKIINVAYDVLSDPVKRAEHDAWLAANEKPRINGYTAYGTGERAADGEQQPYQDEESGFHYRMLFRWPILLCLAAALMFGVYIGSGNSSDSGGTTAARGQADYESRVSKDAGLSPGNDEAAEQTSEVAAYRQAPAESADRPNRGTKAGGTSRLPPSHPDMQARAEAGKSLESSATLPADPEQLKNIAVHGNVHAQFALAMLHFNKQEYSEAIYWCRKAAERDYATAQFQLAQMYRKGDGVAKDRDRALYWYGKAAEQGHADAQYHLGLIYLGEQNMKRDYYKGIYWLRKAAQQGHGEAEKLLDLQDQSPGRLIVSGDGKISVSMPPKCFIKPVMSDEELENCVR